MSYYLAPSLKQLRDEIDAAHPGRDKKSDGWVGDISHQARKSDHNPDYASGGVVRAIDVDISDIDVNKLMAVLKNDSRVNYFIYNHSIYGASSFAKRRYTGSNPHVQHIHVSIKHSKSAERAGAWGYSGGSVKPVGNTKPKPKPAKAKGTDENKSIQTALKTMGLKVGVIDGVNGPMQKAAVKAFQKHHNLVQDGNWGPVTQKAFTLNKAVQKALRDEGYTKQTVDGYYGDQTAANVRD
ncbi:peptidoglycan-binding domain-containing protein [Glutamicibacter arilaitensis]|uniref:peptidoglycan-binding domain-containing protein n=1 Tax=Glutamicibacter arilaitensis TaxID=256701 RepID=UPI003F92476C